MRKFLFLLTFFFISTPYAFAATFPANTISVNPSLVQLDLQTDQPQATLQYSNTTNQTVELSLSASNFTDLENGWNLSFLEDKNAQNYKYGLASWINFDKKSLILNPHETGNVTILINKNELSPGGHYGSILAEVVQQTSSGDIGIKSILASSLFVRTNTGREVENGFIEYFTSPQNFFDFPNTYVMRFENTGDVDVTPHGLLTVTDVFGRIIAKGIVNQGSLISFPESVRRFDIPIKNLSSFIFPGKYTATISVHFGKSEKKLTASRSFFSQGSLPLFPIAIGIVIIVCVGMYLFLKRRNLQRNRS